MITASVCGGDQACITTSLEKLGHADAAEKASRVAAASGSDSSDGEGGGGSGQARWYGSGEQEAAGGGRWDGGSWDGGNGSDSGSGDGSGVWQGSERQQLESSWRQQEAAGGRRQGVELALDLDSWQHVGYPTAVLAAVVACKNGVKRAHLIDADSDG